MIRFREYLIVFAVAAVVTWLATFLVRVMAKRHSLLVAPDEMRVHERPTPTAGGAAMYLGLLAAMAVASQIPAFAPVFQGNSIPLGVVVGGSVIFAVGLADDVRELSPPAKLAGQVLAGTALYFFGVSMLFFRVPVVHTLLSLGSNWAPLATVVWVAIMANAVNFIDGLDGLAAGVVGIGAAAFFVYAHQLVQVGNIPSGNAGPLIAVVVLGLCVGFLPHNFHPARIFMGDAGAMLLGALMAASTISVVGQDPVPYSGHTYFFFAPVLIPFVILGIPILDTVFAVVRRASQRTSPAARDVNHLHHRLMRLGHGYRPTVLILWAWTALLSGAVLWPGITDSHNDIPPIAAVALLVMLYTLFAPRGRAAVTGNSNGARNGAARSGNGSHGTTGGPRYSSAPRHAAAPPPAVNERAAGTGRPAAVAVKGRGPDGNTNGNATGIGKGGPAHGALAPGRSSVRVITDEPAITITDEPAIPAAVGPARELPGLPARRGANGPVPAPTRPRSEVPPP